MKFVTFFALIIGFSATQAHAQGAPINPWQHCGIGAMVFPNNGAAAAISNIIWDLGTTAVSSKISSETNCAGNPNYQAAMFMMQSYANLEEDTLNGQGQHITTVLDIYNCSPASHTGIIENIKTDFSKEVFSPAYSAKPELEKVKSYYEIVNKNTQACSA